MSNTVDQVRIEHLKDKLLTLIFDDTPNGIGAAAAKRIVDNTGRFCRTLETVDLDRVLHDATLQASWVESQHYGMGILSKDYREYTVEHYVIHVIRFLLVERLLETIEGGNGEYNE